MARPPLVCLYKRKDSPFYWVKWYSDGRPVQKSTKIADQAQAQLVAQALQVQLTQRYLGIASPVPMAGSQRALTLAELVAEYVKRQLYVGKVSDRHSEVQTARLNSVAKAIGGGIPAAHLTTAAVEDFVRDRLAGEHPVSKTTVHNEIVALRACYRWGVKAALIASVPWDVTPPKANTHKDAVAPLAAVERALESADLSSATDRAIYISINTGLRGEDLARLEWSHLDLPRRGWGMLEIATSKRGSTVAFPLHPRVVSALLPHAGTGRVCHVTASDKGFPRKRAAEIFGSRHGVREIRHTLAHHLHRAGADVVLVGALLGHRAGGVTGGYIHAHLDTAKKHIGELPWLRPSYAKTRKPKPAKG